MKLNKKGYMLVEIVIAFTLAMGIAYYLLTLTYKFKNTNEDIYQSTLFQKDKIAITKNIMNDLERNTIKSYEKQSNNSVVIVLADETKRKIEIRNKTITYGKWNGSNYDKTDASYYEKALESFLSIGEIEINATTENNYFEIKIPISSIYDDETYDIKIFGQKVE